MDETLRGKIDACIKTMPCLPVTMRKVLEVCNNPQTSSADLARVISLDPVLLGRTLKLVNSAYGPEQQPVNLVRAVILLGINTVKNLALSSAGTDQVNAGDSQGLDSEGYWRHSLRVGVAAKYIARKRGVDPRLLEEHFAAGLLHDIGKVPLSAALGGDYLRAVKDAESRKIPLFQGETDTLGINHAQAGELAAKAWRIGGALGDAVIHHHAYTEYPGEHKDLLYSIVAANYFASRMETGFSLYPREPEDTVWKTLDLSWEDLEDIQPAVDDALANARIFLKSVSTKNP
jgi:HD-like signal output (HDOD) protein